MVVSERARIAAANRLLDRAHGRVRAEGTGGKTLEDDEAQARTMERRTPGVFTREALGVTPDPWQTRR